MYLINRMMINLVQFDRLYYLVQIVHFQENKAKYTKPA